MSFIPKIKAVMVEGHSKLKVTDVTGVYHATNNPTGWENAITLLAGNVTASTITIENNGNTQTIDVLSQLPNPVTGEIEYNYIPITDYLDGKTTVTYSLTDGTETYKTTVDYYFFCQARCCIDKMWARLKSQIIADSCAFEKALDDALMAEGLFKAMISSIRSADEATMNTILAKINRICKINKCKCS